MAKVCKNRKEYFGYGDLIMRICKALGICTKGPKSVPVIRCINLITYSRTFSQCGGITDEEIFGSSNTENHLEECDEQPRQRSRRRIPIRETPINEGNPPEQHGPPATEIGQQEPVGQPSEYNPTDGEPNFDNFTISWEECLQPTGRVPEVSLNDLLNTHRIGTQEVPNRDLPYQEVPHRQMPTPSEAPENITGGTSRPPPGSVTGESSQHTNELLKTMKTMQEAMLLLMEETEKRKECCENRSCLDQPDP